MVSKGRSSIIGETADSGQRPHPTHLSARRMARFGRWGTVQGWGSRHAAAAGWQPAAGHWAASVMHLQHAWSHCCPRSRSSAARSALQAAGTQAPVSCVQPSDAVDAGAPALLQPPADRLVKIKDRDSCSRNYVDDPAKQKSKFCARSTGQL